MKTNGLQIFQEEYKYFFKIQSNKKVKNKNHPNQAKKPKCKYTQSQQRKSTRIR